MSGPLLLLMAVWLAVAVVGTVVTGWFWLTLVALALILTTGALGSATHHPRT